MTRRTHAKTRTGCATCKARRIKCKEEKPACSNCIKHGTICPGYEEILKPAIRSKRARSDIEKVDLIAESLHDVKSMRKPTTQDASSTAGSDTRSIEHIVPPSTQTDEGDDFENVFDDYAAFDSEATKMFRQGKDDFQDDRAMQRTRPPGESDNGQISDMNLSLLRAFSDALANVPSLTFTAERAFWQDIHRYSSKWSSVMESVLSFAATYMHFITQDEAYAEAAFVHRGSALAALQRDLACDKGGVDAAVASSILLADQAGFEGDWRSSILHQRGLFDLCLHNLHSSNNSIIHESQLHHARRDRMLTDPLYLDPIYHTFSWQTCYRSLQTFAYLCASSGRNPALAHLDFLGRRSIFQSASREPVDFAAGGLQHLFMLVCNVHRSFGAIEVQSADNLSDPALSNRTVLHSQIESGFWLSCLSPDIISNVLESEPTALLLLAYKYALDLLLHRCIILHQGGEPVIPTPAVVIAISYLQNCFDVLAQDENKMFSPVEHEIVKECLQWPTYVLEFAIDFTKAENVEAAVYKSRLLSESLSSKTQREGQNKTASEFAD